MFARKSLVILAGNVAGGLLGLVALKLIALYFGPAAWGELAYATAIVGLAYLLQELGFSHAHIKFVSEGRDIGRCLTTFLVIKVGLTLLFVVSVLTGLFVYGVVLGKPLQTTTYGAIYIMLAANVVTSLRGVNRFTLEARLETAKSQILTISETFFRVVLTAVFAASVASFGAAIPFLSESGLAAWVRENPAEALAITFLAGSIASALYGIYATRDIPWGEFDKDLAKAYAKFAFPFTILNLVGVMSAYIDSFAVGYFWNSAEVGLLASAQRVVLLIALVPNAVGTLLFPHISSLHAKGEQGDIRSSFERTLRYISLVVVPMTVFVVAYADPIIRVLLASDFVGGASVLVALTINTLLVALSTPYTALVTGMNRPGVAARVGVTTGFLVVALNLIFIPTSLFGIPMFGLKAFGAAIGTALASLVGFILLRLAAYRLVGVGGAWFHLLRQMAAGAIMFGALLALAALVPDFGRAYHLVIAAAVGGLVYLGALVALRELKRDDWAFFLDLVKPGPTLRYFRDELRDK